MVSVSWVIISIKIHTPIWRPSVRTTQVSRYQKGRTNLDLTEARDSEWQWHQLGHMQDRTMLQTDNHASTPPLSFLQAGCPSCCPTVSNHWRQISIKIYEHYYKILYVPLQGIVSMSPLSPLAAQESVQSRLPTYHLPHSDAELCHSAPHQMTHIYESASHEEVDHCVQFPEARQTAGADIPPDSPIRSMFV